MFRPVRQLRTGSASNFFHCIVPARVWTHDELLEGFQCQCLAHSSQRDISDAIVCATGGFALAFRQKVVCSSSRATTLIGVVETVSSHLAVIGLAQMT